MQLRWSDIVARNDGVDENKASICGYYMNCLGVDLENISNSIVEPCALYETEEKHFKKPMFQRVYLETIVGTSYRDYAGDTWLDALLRLHRADRYIKKGAAVRGKYFRLMKQSYLDIPPVCLSRDKDGRCYVDGNGNHRVTFYKLMQLTDGMMEKAVVKQWYHVEKERNAHTLYWLYAYIKDEV